MEDWAESVLGSVCVDGVEAVLEQVEQWEVCLRLLENLSLDLLGQLQSLLEDRSVCVHLLGALWADDPSVWAFLNF